MPKLTLDVDPELYRLLQQAARTNQLSLQDECMRRSRYVDALLAELHAEGQQRRAAKD